MPLFSPAASTVTDATISTSDVTTNNAATTKHGFLKKLSNVSTEYMDGIGAWSTPAGGAAGALTFLATQTASSSAQLDFTAISSTYETYVFEFLNILPATAGADLNWLAGTGAGPTYDSTSGHYAWTNIFSYINTGGGEGNGTGQTAGVIAGQCSNATMGLSGQARLIDPENASAFKPLVGQITYYHNSVGYIQRGFSAVFIQSTAMTAVRFKFSSGNIASGTIRMYGVTKA